MLVSDVVSLNPAKTNPTQIPKAVMQLCGDAYPCCAQPFGAKGFFESSSCTFIHILFAYLLVRHRITAVRGVHRALARSLPGSPWRTPVANETNHLEL